MLAAVAGIGMLLAACGDSGAPSSRADGAAGPQLRRDGRFMVDEKNRVVLLHGVNAVWKLAPYFPPSQAAGFVAADADWLRDHGFNTVRLGVIFAGVMPQPGAVDQAYLEGVDRVVQLLASRGIWTMLDFHQDMYNERFEGEGFPDWAVFDDGIPHLNDFGFPGNYFTPECSRAFDNFWDNKEGLWDHYRSAWKAVASKWKDQPYLMGYDLINEPWPGTDLASCANPLGCPLHDDLKLQALHSHVLDGIREVDRGNIVWFEPNLTFNEGAKTNFGLLTPLTDANLGLSWHKYCLTASLLHADGFTDVPGCTELHQLVSDNAEEAIARMNATTLITEFGASDDIPDLVQVMTQADAQLTGWQYWHYKGWMDPTSEDPTGGAQSLFGNDADLGSAKLDKLKVLERTYPQFTAGIPLALTFNHDSAEFNYRYQPRTAGGPTEIYVPVTLHYPQGYRVEASGASIRSGENAPLLILENSTGASEVTVHVVRR
ncbi:MAG: cellulase family glycosylhydrolase [Hydrocarboniphaga effusa]|nr:cellulase family glycosylhydrolase [Hydrocarboniphaga effusa]